MRFRRLIAALAVGALGSLWLPASPANAGPYCRDLDVVFCVVIYAIEKVDCKVNGNCQ